MRGFIAGVLLLIVLDVVTQDGAADKLGSAGVLVNKFLKRAISPAVAGVPQRKSLSKSSTDSSSKDNGGGPAAAGGGGGGGSW